MTTSLRFDPAAVRALASEKVFARGEAYHRAGQVLILSLDPDRVLARVAGTENYCVELTGAGDDIGGECACPAFEDHGFCKHMVATALAANAGGARNSEESAGSRIRAYLKAKGIDALVEMVIDHAERDEVWFRSLDMASAAAGDDDKALAARLKRAIDAATRTRDYIDYREAHGWATGVDAVLDTLAELACGKRAGLVMALAERLIDRVEAAIGSIDDSDGHCGGLLERAADIHREAAAAAPVDPIALACDLFRREIESEYGIFNGAAEHYADVLGDAGRAEYRRLATEAWAALPPLSRASRAQGGGGGGYRRLTAILDHFARDDGDIEARIALRLKDLSSAYDYLSLAEFCLAHGRADEALRRAEEGLWVFEDDRRDERLVGFAADRLCEAGRPEEAQAHLWKAFQAAPSLDLYARLIAVGGQPARERCMGLLESRVDAGPTSRWYSPADLPIRILIGEGEADKAWAMLRRRSASTGVQEALARATEATHPAEGAAIYAERVDALVESGNARAYAEAAALVERMKALQQPVEHAAYVMNLKTRFRRRRTFIPLLE